jgi:amidase
MDATAMAQAVRDGELHPRELVDAACGSLAESAAVLHHLASERFDSARREADLLDTSAPFAGVPILLKDHLAAMAGEPLWSGSAYLKRRDHRAPTDAPLTAAIRRAGFVVCGRGTCSELAATPTSEPAAFPAVRNPWAPERVAGGSSGGSAAAVSCGAIPIAHGNDTGGSLRIPAAACGIVGFKPSRGLMPLAPLLAAIEPGLGLTSDFFLTRSVRDASALLRIFGGVGVRPTRVAGATIPSSLALRVGVHTSASNVGAVTDPVCVQAAERALTMLEGLGHHVVEARPAALDDPSLAAVTLPVVACAMAATVHRLTSEVGAPPAADELEPYTRAMIDIGSRTSFVDYVELLQPLRDFGNRVLHGWNDIDLLVTPTLAELPPPIGTYTDDQQPMWPMVRSAPEVSFTSPFNITGQPAISLPLWHDQRSGLPVGVQIVAAPGQDDALLRVAADLEEAVAWPVPPAFGRHPSR